MTNLCPGPADFKCCQSAENGEGGYDGPPPFYGKAPCKKVAVDGAEKIVAQFPKRIREVGCYRERKPGDRASDHHTGMATDMMCSDDLGKATLSGKEIAKWVMDNHAALSVKYVIWGQRIWESGQSVRSWEEWEVMEDRGSLTENHWVRRDFGTRGVHLPMLTSAPGPCSCQLQGISGHTGSIPCSSLGPWLGSSFSFF